MRAALYARVSTEDQEREGTSLDTQIEACHKYAEEHGYEVQEEHILKEAYSGLTLERPYLDILRAWVANKEVDGVVVYSTDRLSRDPVHLLLLVEEFEKKKAELHFVTEPLDNTPEGQLLTFVRGWAAKLEAAKIQERTNRGRRARALAGKLPSASHLGLYGYDYLPGREIGEGVRYVKEEEAKWVREMFQWLVEESLSTRAVTYRLRELGVPTPKGNGFWQKSTVSRILSNPAYCGKTYAFTQSKGVRKPKEEWLEIPDATPPIISEELFEAAQGQLQRNRELAPRNGKRQYLLKGHVQCRQCGRNYWSNVSHGRRYYGCSGSLKIVTPEKCYNRRTNADTLEDMVWEQVEAIITKPELVLAELERRQEESAQVTHLEKDLERIETQLANRDKQKARAWKAFEITGDEDAFKASISRLSEETKALEEEKRQIEKRVRDNQQFNPNIEDVQQACELIRQNLRGVSFEDKRFILEALQVKVWIDGNEVAIEGAIPIGDIATTTCCRSVHNTPQSYPFALSVPQPLAGTR